MNYTSSLAATIFIVAAGSCSLWWGTDAWTAWTAESARRVAVAEEPVKLPEVQIKDIRDGDRELRPGDTRLLLLDFIYTRCPSTCLSMGAEFAALQREIALRDWTQDLALLSISFDAEDGPAELAGYLKRFRADTSLWTAAEVPDGDALRELLGALDVIVIPEPSVGYVHNAAIYLVDGGAVVGIFDFDDRSAILHAINSRLKVAAS